jgi:IS5 family transposase
MLRIYFMQQWYALSDPAMEDALYEIESMRCFARLDLTDDAMPDETTILNFRHLLERHALTAQLAWVRLLKTSIDQGFLRGSPNVELRRFSRLSGTRMARLVTHHDKSLVVMMAHPKPPD